MSEEHEEYEVEALGVEVSAQPIELYKVLKIANAVSGGGEAKFAISEGYVAVNGELEQRKRRKVYDGDVVEFNNEFYLVLCDQPVTEVAERPKKETEPKAASHAKPGSKATKSKEQGTKAKGSRNQAAKANKGRRGNVAKETKAKGPADKATGRKPISF
ncbi:RNA-binding S4 domain-containing protein [Photobacterium sp. DNB23_23_1]|uniref:RNA-binding S4 domain-containing protein n=1 Tax=Photobacterium pectinilyticum TaxID=2906793 RepID=A0ABT1MZS9_9GAMM|nr:RNA-binding S4 domain-containing protein [Photobacterium sp. ZSDE20]MCQ1058008.1 RNA-binding S4 domain-containing protein [Photobacterium sp. ZSDE20]MDD1822541.1 RNA-binding S4 domain-containing protein [Photobacterium sp. ZSDE20]